MATYWENSCSFGLRYVSWYKYLIVSLVFSHLGFWSGNLFLIAPFPDLCLLVPFIQVTQRKRLECKFYFPFQRAISPKMRYPELWFFCSARRLMLVNNLLKFHQDSCCGPLQKLRVRLWPCKTGLSPPVTLCY